MEKEYDLLIEPVIKSNNKRILLVFKPKELIEGSVFELKFKITNKTGNSFPGGTLKDIETFNAKEGITTSFDDKKVPRIPSHENRTIEISKCLPYTSGVLGMECKLESEDRNPINFYQKDRIDDKSDLLKSKKWEDYITITSRYEINQRYTNYILSIMTLLLLCFTAVQISSILLPFLMS